ATSDAAPPGTSNSYGLSDFEAILSKLYTPFRAPDSSQPADAGAAPKPWSAGSVAASRLCRGQDEPPTISNSTAQPVVDTCRCRPHSIRCGHGLLFGPAI